MSLLITDMSQNCYNVLFNRVRMLQGVFPGGISALFNTKILSAQNIALFNPEFSKRKYWH